MYQLISRTNTEEGNYQKFIFSLQSVYWNQKTSGTHRHGSADGRAIPSGQVPDEVGRRGGHECRYLYSIRGTPPRAFSQIIDKTANVHFHSISRYFTGQ